MRSHRAHWKRRFRHTRSVLRPGERQVTHAYPWALLDRERGAPATGATTGARDQLNLEVELVANLDDALDFEPFEPDETGKVILHPLFLLAPRSMTTQSLQRAADVFLLGLNRLCSFDSPVVLSGSAGPAAMKRSP